MGMAKRHPLLRWVGKNPDTWWRTSGALFLVAYGMYSFRSGTVEAAIMLNLLHLIVGLPALVLLPGAVRNGRDSSVPDLTDNPRPLNP